MDEVELRERLVHIDQMLTDSEHKREDLRRIIAEHDRRRQEIWWYPLVVTISAVTAGAALFAAAFAFAKLFA